MKLSTLVPLFFGGFLLLMFIEDSNPKSQLTGQEAPSIALTQVGNTRVFTDNSLRMGGVKLVNFWASWCGACRSEHPVWHDLADQGVTIYGVGIGDTPKSLNDCLKSSGNPYHRFGADRNDKTAINWGIRSIPTTFLIDENGVIIDRFIGPMTHEIYERRIRPVIDAAS